MKGKGNKKMNRVLIITAWILIMFGYCAFYVWMAHIDFKEGEKE